MATTTPSLNGKPQRKQLSDQLDRLDSIIDCLAEALPEAVADATREGTRQALRELFVEMLTDPEILKKLRAALAPEVVVPPPSPQPKAPPQPTRFERLKSATRNLLGRVRLPLPNGVKEIASRIKSTCGRARAKVQTTVSSAVQAIRTLKAGMPVARFAGVALGVGVAVALTSYVAPHAVAAIVSGVGAACTTAAFLVSGWARRSLRAFGLGTS